MKKRLLVLISSILLVLLLVEPVSAAITYIMSFTISGTGTAITSTGMSLLVNNNLLASNGYISPTGLDTQVLDSSVVLPSMVVSDRTMFVDTYSGSQKNLQYTFGNTPASQFSIIPGNGGYITITDAAALEPAGVWSINMSGCFNVATPVYVGNTLTNGTGGATGSPVTLSVGNNTITVATLGTFTVALRDGVNAVATSVSTCLVTGSPLVLYPGSTLITITGATGTFKLTVYPSKYIVNKAAALLVSASPTIAGRIDAIVATYTAKENIVGSVSTTKSPVGKGQTWTATASYTLTEVKLGSANGVTYSDLMVGIYATTAGVAVGAPLSIGGPVTGTSASNGVLIPMYPCTITNGTMYALVGLGGTFTGWIEETDSPYANGTCLTGITWTVDGTIVNCSTAGNDNNINIYTAPNVTVTGVTATSHVIVISETAAGAGTLSLQVDAAAPVTVAAAGNVPNSANDWIIGQAIVYLDYYKETVTATEVIKYQPVAIISGTTLPDIDTGDGTQNGTFTFGSNPADVTVAAGTLVPQGVTSSSGTSGTNDVYNFMGPSPGGNVAAIGSGSSATNLPDYPFVQPVVQMAQANGMTGFTLSWVRGIEVLVLMLIVGTIIICWTKSMLFTGIAEVAVLTGAFAHSVTDFYIVAGVAVVLVSIWVLASGRVSI